MRGNAVSSLSDGEVLHNRKVRASEGAQFTHRFSVCIG